MDSAMIGREQMRKYIYIGCGGFAGAIARYLIKTIQVTGFYENFPAKTLVINILGSFLLAFIMKIGFDVKEFDADLRIGVTTGFLGAFTTFSTLCKETVGLLDNGEYFSSIIYITFSILLGMGAAFFGIVLAKEIGLKYFKRKGLADSVEIERDVE